MRTLGSEALSRRIAETFQNLDGLEEDRKAIDAGRTDRLRASTAFAASSPPSTASMTPWRRWTTRRSPRTPRRSSS
ncbi:hypothetical protein ACFQX6_01040 [Streptosporangium lutulentum]